MDVDPYGVLFNRHHSKGGNRWTVGGTERVIQSISVTQIHPEIVISQLTVQHAEALSQSFIIRGQRDVRDVILITCYLLCQRNRDHSL